MEENLNCETHKNPASSGIAPDQLPKPVKFGKGPFTTKNKKNHKNRKKGVSYIKSSLDKSNRSAF
jgi:hypothetical protein